MDTDARIAAWLSRELGLRNPVPGAALSGGNINTTRLVETDRDPVVVRYAPSAAISPRSGDGVRREAAILAAVEKAGVTPRLLGFCDDDRAIGQPFMVMSFVDGVSLTDTLPSAYAAEPAAVDDLGRSLIDAIAAIHLLDPGTVAIKTGEPAQFVERQVGRWLDLRQKTSVRALPLLDEVGRWLLANRPKPDAPAIVHGDYHLDNTLCRRDRAAVAAIIDWELATIADPLIDVALLLMFWGKRAVSTPAFPHVQSVTRDRPVVSRQALADRWARTTGRSTDNLPYYACFMFWRLAAMVEGSYVLHVRGEATSDYARGLEANVPLLLEEAAAVAAHGF